MKVVFLVHSLSMGGAERATVRWAEYWHSIGWDVHIITLSQGQNELSCPPHIPRHNCGLENSSKASVFRRCFTLVRRLKALRRLLKQIQPDVVLGMTVGPSLLLALLSRFSSKRSPPYLTVACERTYPPLMPEGQITKVLRRYLYAYVDMVQSQTTQGADWLQAHTGCLKCCVIPNGITLPVLSPQPRSKGYVMLAVGRLDPVKGFDRLIRVFARLNAVHPDWILRIVGQGQEYDHLSDLIQAEGCQSVIELCGAASDMSAQYQQADVLVLSSHVEGFPNVILEALAHGLPVVSVDCQTGPRECITHGVNGLLVPQDDMVGLEQACSAIMSDHEMRKRMASEAVDSVRSFTFDRVHQQWHDMFRSLNNQEN